MSKIGTTLTNYNSQGLIGKRRVESSISSSPPIFVLCDTCYWCATFIDKSKIPTDNSCPECGANNSELTSFPIASNESFNFDYNSKHGVELEFRPRPKRT